MGQKPTGEGTLPGSGLTTEEVEFGRAVDQYKRRHGRPYPGFSEILAVAASLGYRKVAQARPLPKWDRESNRAVQVDVMTGIDASGPGQPPRSKGAAAAT